MRRDAVFPANDSTSPDMSSLFFINEPAILRNLEERALRDEPYTFMSNVLVAINPLKRLRDPSIRGLDPSTPHPYAVAKNAFSQLVFSYNNAKYKLDNEAINQSIVTSGESGAGKTEQCKMLLHYLVNEPSLSKSSSKHNNEIDQKLLQSNVITEAFGNAQTLRNPNSSRFGKFMKISYFPGDVSIWSISHAGVETYLLERSRVSLHNSGEQTFHIFYQLYRAAEKGLVKNLHLTDNGVVQCGGFRYLTPLSAADATADAKLFQKEIATKNSENTVDSFKQLNSAFADLGVKEAEYMLIYQAVATVLHLGNICFQNNNVNNNDVAQFQSFNEGYSAEKVASDLLGVHVDQLYAVLTRSELKVRKQVIVKQLDSLKATYARDALAKFLYSCIFQHVIQIIKDSLKNTDASEYELQENPYLVIVDIFGFETFDKNGFEQLLINFANEALQATFNKSVFENELDLYKKEGLVLEGQNTLTPPDNTATMLMFIGNPNTQNISLKVGVLSTIDDVSTGLEPSDKKLLANLHRGFGSHKSWIKPHPRMKSELFIVNHFAGQCAYTIDSFIEKNQDQVPDAVLKFLQGSTFSSMTQHAVKNVKSKTIIKTFKSQIQGLVENLESTKCSFIRCVKPCAEMFRGKSNDWFNRRYISMQLRKLSIPQTAEVLQSGFPTRIKYDVLLEKYQNLLPKSPLMNPSSNNYASLFVRALFWAFELTADDFKPGLTMVFFKSGKLSKIDKMLKSTQNISKADLTTISKRFTNFFARLRWRQVYVKVLASNKFIHLLKIVREKEAERQRKLEEERKLKEKEEAERKRREEELEALEQKKLQKEQDLLNRLTIERKRRKDDTKDGEDSEAAALIDQLEVQAKENVELELELRAESVSSSEVMKRQEEEEDKLVEEYAKNEAQQEFEEKVQQFFADIDSKFTSAIKALGE
eukprot:maker-scaffold_3-augustus-gene-16.4-mRNA-1 protein AED:0.35 eAED:0.36 QI:0/0/0/0.5/1/1/2/1050/930